MGGGYQQVMYAVQNMIATLTGMICDGAKPSCALKLTSGVSTAVMSAIMAMEQKCVTAVEGIIEENRKSEYTQSYQDRFGRNERNRQACIRYYDP